jgi:hypothetical protein
MGRIVFLPEDLLNTLRMFGICTLNIIGNAYGDKYLVSRLVLCSGSGFGCYTWNHDLVCLTKLTKGTHSFDR